MVYRLQGGNFYVDGELLGNIKECEITSSEISDKRVTKINSPQCQAATFSGELNNLSRDVMKLFGFKWYQRMWVRIKYFFRKIRPR